MTKKSREKLITDIRRYLDQDVITLDQLAKKYGVSKAYVHKLKTKLALDLV